jgi:hypothetical protein
VLITSNVWLLLNRVLEDDDVEPARGGVGAVRAFLLQRSSLGKNAKRLWVIHVPRSVTHIILHTDHLKFTYCILYRRGARRSGAA